MDTTVIRVAAFAGSLRRESLNRRLVEAARELAPNGMEIDHILLDSVPLFNVELEADLPPGVVDFKARIAAADAVLMAVPEHNFSFSGVLKNAIDWASRPPRRDVLTGKPVATMSASPSWTGGLRAQIQLRPVLGYFPMEVMLFPEVSIGKAHEKFDESGRLADEFAREQVQKLMNAFHAFIVERKNR